VEILKLNQGGFPSSGFKLDENNCDDSESVADDDDDEDDDNRIF
jgi:hypothetical protein